MNTHSILNYFSAAVQQLTTIYDKSEAENILQIFFEDAFQIKNLDNSAILTREQIQQLNNALARLLQHEPVQYILGEADFFGYKFKVSPAVLIPRPETEELVDLIIQQCKKEVADSDDFRIMDIGTGSGCIPIVLKKKLPNARVIALDVSAEALAVAEKNGDLNEVDIDWKQMDVLNMFLWQQFMDANLNVIVSNPPYIPHKEKAMMAENVLNYEPKLALFVNDETPLIFYKVIALFASKKLKNNGRLYLECNEFNASEVGIILEDLNFKNIVVASDMSGKDRMVSATWLV